MTSSARYSGPVSENPATVGVGTRQPGAYACAVISTTLAPRITNAQKMNEWSTPAYHSRATFRWKIPYTTKDRKSTRLNSSHLVISYAVFCLKKKKNQQVDNG